MDDVRIKVGDREKKLATNTRSLAILNWKIVQPVTFFLLHLSLSLSLGTRSVYWFDRFLFPSFILGCFVGFFLVFEHEKSNRRRICKWKWATANSDLSINMACSHLIRTMKNKPKKQRDVVGRTVFSSCACIVISIDRSCDAIALLSMCVLFFGHSFIP